jgi:hypothetical protein
VRLEKRLMWFMKTQEKRLVQQPGKLLVEEQQWQQPVVKWVPWLGVRWSRSREGRRRSWWADWAFIVAVSLANSTLVREARNEIPRTSPL